VRYLQWDWRRPGGSQARKAAAQLSDRVSGRQSVEFAHCPNVFRDYSRFVTNSASVEASDSSLLYRSVLLVLAFVFPLALSLWANEPANSSSTGLAHESAFALGGIGVAGTTSPGESDLRAVLKEPDAVQRLQSLLKKASPAGQLYALLGLRLRDRPAYEQALPEVRKRTDLVSTMHGCIMMKEKMDSIVRQIEHGDYDAILAASPR
jgi:hypothetical protein